MIKIGPYTIHAPSVLAPMAGITDQAFRQLCFNHGAGFCVSEMLASKASLWQSKKSRTRKPSSADAGLRIVQLVGTQAQQLAESARYYAAEGAQIIDINMGCPAKKVCRKAAGSALLREPHTVANICHAVVSAVDVPVTLKIRTGWCPDTRNAVEIANIAQDCGIQSLVVHGRTRACRFVGEIEYDSIAHVKQAVTIPVIANGDIDSPQQAKFVLDYTGADGVMIGRAAQGNPWIFASINHYLATGTLIEPPSTSQIITTMMQHVQQCCLLYGDVLGPKIARKHVAAYFEHWFQHAKPLRQAFNRLINLPEQLTFLQTLAASPSDAVSSFNYKNTIGAAA